MITLGLNGIGRRSRYLFDFSPAYALGRADQALTAITGQAATFTRAALTYALDANGRYYAVPYGLPAFEWVDLDGDGIRETCGILLQGSRTNVVLQSDALATSPWAKVGSPTVTNAVGTYAGRSFSRLAYATAWTTDSIYQVPTFTGDGVKAFAVLAKQDGANTGTFVVRLRDQTGAADLCYLTLTVASGGAITGACSYGTLIKTVALADGVYRFDCQSVSVTAANTNRVDIGIAGTCPSILLSGIKAEDATFPSGLIPSTTGTVTTVADALSYTLNITPAQIDAWGGLTVYAQMARPVHADASGTLGPSPIVARFSTSTPLLTLFGNGSASRNMQAQITNSSTSSAAATVPAGAALAISAQFKAITTAPAVAVDVGSGLGAFGTGATAFSALGAQTLNVGTIGGAELYGVLTRLKIAAGLQTLAYMGAG